MRILMATWGWRSHFYNLAPLGWALQAAGHEVRVASHPSMAETIGSAGLVAVPLGADVDFAEAFGGGRIGRVGRLDKALDKASGPATATVRRERQRSVKRQGPVKLADGSLEPSITADGGVVRFADALLDELVAFGRTFRPDLLIWEPFNLAAPVAAAALDVPGVLQLWGPDSSVTLRLDPEEVIGPLAARFGLDATEVNLSGALVLDPVPPPMRVPPPGLSRPVRFVPYNGKAILPDWLRHPTEPGRPRVCVTAGTMMTGAGLTDQMDLGRIVRALAELDAEVVVVVERAQRAELGQLPDNVRLADTPLALSLVLPTCAALVQQGGAGTTMTALALGVPQLILPQVGDHHFIGERLAVTGAGTMLTSAQPDGAAIRDLVGELIGDGHWRESATLMRERINSMPTPAEVVPALADLALGVQI